MRRVGPERSTCTTTTKRGKELGRSWIQPVRFFQKYPNQYGRENDICWKTQNHRAIVTATAATTAVSALKIVGPNDTLTHPADSNSFNSSSAHPPSGPTASATEARLCGADTPVRDPSTTSLSITRSSDSAHTTFNPASIPSSSFSFTGSAISGGDTLLDCCDASCAIRLHRSARFRADCAR